MTKFIGLTNAWNDDKIVVQLACIAVMRPWTLEMEDHDRTGQPCTHLLLTTAQNLDRHEELISDNSIEVKETVAEIYQKIVDAKEV